MYINSCIVVGHMFRRYKYMMNAAVIELTRRAFRCDDIAAGMSDSDQEAFYRDAAARFRDACEVLDSGDPMLARLSQGTISRAYSSIQLAFLDAIIKERVRGRVIASPRRMEDVFRSVF